MKIPPLPPNESKRLEALYSYKILDTLPEQAFDDLTALAACISGTPIALISLLDTHRQWFKSKVGLEATETCRESAFCAYAILQPHEPLIVPDTLKDQRFAANPLVVSEPNIRFYAGFPIVTPQGYALGTLCVIDSIPRQLQPQQIEALCALSRQVSAQLELRLNLFQLTRVNQSLQRSEERFRLLMEGVKDYAILRLATNGRVVSWNAAAEQIKGYQAQNILGEHFSCFYTVEDIQQGKPELGLKIAATQGRFEDEGWRVRQDGSRFWANVVITALHDQAGILRGFVKVTRDLTERKQTEAALLRAAVAEATNHKLELEINQRRRVEAQLLHNAFHDVLTDLPNRALFLERLQRSLLQAKRRNDYLFAVLFLDLDRFKLINDCLGHTVGDELLIGIAQRLSACLREVDTVARLGGDEFVVLLNDIQNLSDAKQIAERIQTQLSLPFNLRGQEVFTTVSIGIALSSGTVNATVYDCPDNILRDADNAMYRAKALGKARYEVFDAAMHAQALERLQLEIDLRRAIERQEFELYYQPIVSLKTLKITGFEALIRWQHPEWGIISPDKFIAIAEETNLIVPIDQWVLREACQQMKAWQFQFPTDPPLTISVNFSGKQFVQSDLAKQVAEILHRTNLDAQCLKLEITESVLIENAKSVTSILSQLKALGVVLCMDDFGTGYSSLSYLHSFPIDILKMDRSFVNSMNCGNGDFKIVQAIIKLAQALGIDVIAEGIETLDQQAQLIALQCKYGQGYLFSQPLNSYTATALLAQQSDRNNNIPFLPWSECLFQAETYNQANGKVNTKDYTEFILTQSEQRRQKLLQLRAYSTELNQVCNQAILEAEKRLVANKKQLSLYQTKKAERDLFRLSKIAQKQNFSK